MNGPHHASPPRRRVVITGMGVIAPNGCDLQPFWESILHGRSAGGVLERFDTSGMPVKIAAEIKNFDGKNFMPLKKARRLDISTQYGIAAARLAFEDSKLRVSALDADRVGVVEGISLGGTETTLKGGDALLKKDYRHINAFSLVNGYTGAGAGEIALELGLRGFAASYCAGSASGNEAIGHAMRMIVDDEVDMMVAGGSEAPFLPELWAVFCLNRVMSSRNESPAQAMKPFDADRDGFLLGEGSAFLVLEELTHALSRGANIYAELAGHGRYCEAFHSVNPHPEGIGVIRAMQRAARMAQIEVRDIHYINAHGTATAANDVAESRALRTLFGEGEQFPAVSSTKPVTGHLLGASGALETVVCALAVATQQVPFTLNCNNVDPECGIPVVQQASRRLPVNVAANLNSGFGGKNACLILKRFLSG
jgi:3-oxoacyl-[acyl-carrier-protein] synthase II